jgi:hypothetical protein
MRENVPEFQVNILGITGKICLIISSYPDETLRPSSLSSCRYGQLSLRITKRFRYQFTSLESAAQHLALCPAVQRILKKSGG